MRSGSKRTLLLRLSYQWRIQEEMVGGFFPFAALPSLPQNGPLKRCKLPVRVRAEPVRQMLLSILVQKSLLGVTVSSKQIKEASDCRYFHRKQIAVCWMRRMHPLTPPLDPPLGHIERMESHAPTITPSPLYQTARRESDETHRKSKIALG